MFGLVLLIVCGAIAAAPWLVARVPRLAPSLATLARVQEWLGAALLLYGVWFAIFHVLLHLTTVTLVACITLAAMLALGFLLAFPLLQRLRVPREARTVRNRIATFQVPLGLAAIVVAVVAWLSGGK